MDTWIAPSDIYIFVRTRKCAVYFQTVVEVNEYFLPQSTTSYTPSTLLLRIITEKQTNQFSKNTYISNLRLYHVKNPFNTYIQLRAYFEATRQYLCLTFPLIRIFFIKYLIILIEIRFAIMFLIFVTS